MGRDLVCACGGVCFDSDEDIVKGEDDTMVIDKQMCRLMAELEYIIGSECYNPSSYDGWNDIEGCEFRYPINVPDEEGTYTKIRGNINTSYLVDQESITVNTIRYLKYKFGANELFIGLGIIRTLEYLEKRYDLDFNKLEEDYMKKSAE